MADDKETTTDTVTMTRAELDAYFDEKLASHRAASDKQVEQLRALIPSNTVPAHAGGPGINDIRPSWSLAQQEASLRGDDYE